MWGQRHISERCFILSSVGKCMESPQMVVTLAVTFLKTVLFVCNVIFKDMCLHISKVACISYIRPHTILSYFDITWQLSCIFNYIFNQTMLQRHYFLFGHDKSVILTILKTDLISSYAIFCRYPILAVISGVFGDE